ncbi:MAG: hypothetical protein Q8N35_13175 [Methylococcaceae bacterium]|uniref:hypothetical protein n=1 Tax=Methylicorpusculum sp. TaxID=2713644 RepID=UPI00271D96D4|nr:hypothetical protein [Methylicorpusculum sp.]MDO9163563.1 hypothetical protein [Methylococcaceae bacterium]MDP2395030.1 hypothetical protein [Methylococcaceae bacterium]MDP3020530.1 hypothetical protein [Methylococcaceae bacterium]MDP3389722.1 hypothetical protein [Methylococcaceae bacterium]MDP3932518.1 hypothetical protein [Methylococcaceae bacterium]
MAPLHALIKIGLALGLIIGGVLLIKAAIFGAMTVEKKIIGLLRCKHCPHQ